MRYAIIQVSFFFTAGAERCRQNQCQYWSFFLTMPSPGSSPWHSFILVQCPAMCLVPDGGKCVPSKYPCLEPVGSFDWKNKTKTKAGLVVPRVPFQSRGGGGVKSFYYKRSRKTLHLTYLGMLHMLYYMKEKLQIAFIMTYNAWVMPDCDILIQ